MRYYYMKKGKEMYVVCKLHICVYDKRYVWINERKIEEIKWKKKYKHIYIIYNLHIVVVIHCLEIWVLNCKKWWYEQSCERSLNLVCIERYNVCECIK